MGLSKVFSVINAIKSIYSTWWLVFSGGWIVVVSAFAIFMRTIVGNDLYLAIFSVIVALILIAGFLWSLWYSMGNIPGINTPRYLNWYKFRLRKIKWDFDNCLSMQAKAGKGPIISRFHAGIMVTRGDGIKPKRAVIKSFKKGYEIELVIESDPQYKPASEMTLIPKSSRYWGIICVFDPVMDGVDFLKEYPGFEFIFEYDKSTFKKRFSRDELKWMIDRSMEFTNPPVPLQPY